MKTRQQPKAAAAAYEGGENESENGGDQPARNSKNWRDGWLKSGGNVKIWLAKSENDVSETEASAAAN
jgi:hypothetical protein